jgi:hypothetical protein
MKKYSGINIDEFDGENVVMEYWSVGTHYSNTPLLHYLTTQKNQ